MKPVSTSPAMKPGWLRRALRNWVLVLGPTTLYWSRAYVRLLMALSRS